MFHKNVPQCRNVPRRLLKLRPNLKTPTPTPTPKIFLPLPLPLPLRITRTRTRTRTRARAHAHAHTRTRAQKKRRAARPAPFYRLVFCFDSINQSTTKKTTKEIMRQPPSELQSRLRPFSLFPLHTRQPQRPACLKNANQIYHHLPPRNRATFSGN